tara:strand:+ start:514 stop:822 length:309 start_codon:yes stop_codon:yes gene_type:complete
MLDKICSPALLYLGFSLTQITIDTFNNQYNKAMVKFVIMIFFTLILNILCNRGLGIVSWIVVFLPFIMLTYITSILLFIFGLDPEQSDYNFIIKNDNNSKNI